MTAIRPTGVAHPLPPVFIMGCRRSGTTLVSRLIDAHSRFAVYHESFLYPIFRSELRWYGPLSREQNLARLIDDVREVLATQTADVPSRRAIRAAMARADFAALFSALLHLHAVQSGKARGGDKTPEHHRHLDEILAGFPESPVLFVTRDPRDTVHSNRRVFSSSVEGAAYAWREAFDDYRRRAGEVQLVRFESLVREPERTLRSICAALHEPYESRMLEFHRHVPDTLRGRLGGEKLAGPIDTDSVGRYHEFSRPDVALVERICGEGMEALGYAFETDRAGSPGGPASARPERPRLAWMLDRLRYYGMRPARWRRGWARWKVMLRVRLRYVLTLGAAGRSG